MKLLTSVFNTPPYLQHAIKMGCNYALLKLAKLVDDYPGYMIEMT
jgi:hypothetical protein